MLELVEEQRLPIPRALYKMALGMMRRSVKKRAHFNIDAVSPIDVVQESFIPALFGEPSHVALQPDTALAAGSNVMCGLLIRLLCSAT